MSDYNCWSGVIKDMDDLKAEIQKLQEENKLLRECVEFYADAENWDFDNNDIDDKELIRYSESDNKLFVVENGEYEDWICGKLARQTLVKIKGDV